MTQFKYYVYVRYMVSFSIMSMISPVSTDIRPAKPLYLGLILHAFPLHRYIVYEFFNVRLKFISLNESKFNRYFHLV